MALWPAPSLVTNQPSDGAALQVALVVGSGYPERHAVSKVNGGVTQLVLVCRVQGFHRLAAIEQLAKSPLGLVAGIIIVLIQPECGARQVGK